jgi:enoyl-CoA hydratase/carnithine racemase
MTFTRFTVDSSTQSLWRVTFDHPPINLIDHVMIGELGELLAEVERNEEPAVLVFHSADPDYFLAHYDIAADPGLVNSLPAGPTGFHPWVDVLVRVSRLPAVTISAIRGRARAAGSEFVLATDVRFASRERAVLGQVEVGFGAAPGGGPASRLPGLVGRGRTLEILLGGEDFDGELAERYGYVNRAIPGGHQAPRQRVLPTGRRRVSPADGRLLEGSGASSATGASQPGVRRRPTTAIRRRTPPR